MNEANKKNSHTRMMKKGRRALSQWKKKLREISKKTVEGG